MKPILFNTEMVQAILEGRKTVTRRVLKLPNHVKQNDNGLYTLFAEGTCYENQSMKDVIEYIKPPYAAGDILYVRETWNWYNDTENGKTYIYRADYGEEHNKGYWKPSIHMPKEAARIFLKVTNVRVERLQDITREDLKKEGLINLCEFCYAPAESCDGCGSDIKREVFVLLWDSTINKKDLPVYGWDANPYVWVIEFEQISKEEAEHGETN